MCTSPTRSKPRRSRIGRDIEPPWVIRAGVPRATASSQRASDQRSVGTSAAGTFRGRAAVEQQAVLGRRGRARADDLAVEPDRVPQRLALAEERRQEALRLGDLGRRGAERLPLDGAGGLELLHRLDPARREAGPHRRRRAGEHEGDCVWILVGPHAAGEERVDEAGRAPMSRPPIASASARARAGGRGPPRAPRRAPPAGSAAAGRCSRSSPARGRACSAASRFARRPARAGRSSSGTRRPRAACSDATGCDEAVTRASWARCARVGGWRL